MRATMPLFLLLLLSAHLRAGEVLPPARIAKAVRDKDVFEKPDVHALGDKLLIVGEGRVTSAPCRAHQ